MEGVAGRDRDDGLGVGTSPVLYEDLMILQCDEDNGDKSFIAALDKRTGKEVWRVARKVQVSWTTPVVAHAGERDELVTSGAELIIAYDPATGQGAVARKGLESNAVPSRWPAATSWCCPPATRPSSRSPCGPAAAAT